MQSAACVLYCILRGRVGFNVFGGVQSTGRTRLIQSASSIVCLQRRGGKDFGVKGGIEWTFGSGRPSSQPVRLTKDLMQLDDPRRADSVSVVQVQVQEGRREAALWPSTAGGRRQQAQSRGLHLQCSAVEDIEAPPRVRDASCDGLWLRTTIRPADIRPGQISTTTHRPADLG